MNEKNTKILHIMPQLHLPGHHSSFSCNLIKELRANNVSNYSVHSDINGHDWISEYNLQNKLISDYVIVPSILQPLKKVYSIIGPINPSGKWTKLCMKVVKHIVSRMHESLETFLLFATMNIKNEYENYDLIFFHDFPRNIGFFISSLFGIVPNNCAVDIHVYTNGNTKNPDGINFLYRRYYHTMLHKINILFHSKALYEYYRTKVYLNPEKLFYVPYGLANDCEMIDKKEALENLNIDTDKKVILFIGTMRKDKGIDLIIESLKKMDDNKYFFLLVGSMYHILDYDVDSLIYSIGWGDSYKRIKFEEHSSYKDYQNYFSAADVLVLPYRKSFIGASGVLANAAEFGLPVIGPNHGQIGEFIETLNLGLTFEAENSDSFVQSLESYFKLNNEKILSFKVGLSNMKQKQSWSNVANKLIDISNKIY